MEKDLGIWIADDLLLETSYLALLKIVVQPANTRSRRTRYLSVVRSVFRQASQVYGHRSRSTLSDVWNEYNDVPQSSC